MKCVFACTNVRTFSRALLSLAKIGDEMYIEGTEDGLYFRTVNLAQSAFAEIKFEKTYFTAFIFRSQDDIDCKYKISMKSCLNVFKNIHTIDKQLQTCEMRVKPCGTILVFEFRFANKSVRKYSLPILESEALEVTFANSHTNILVASSKLLATCLKSFRPAEDEITLAVTKDSVFIRNHLELSREADAVRTEVCYQARDFESHQISEETRITFCMKALRAVVMLAEPADLNIHMAFQTPGVPMVITVSLPQLFEAHYVISTLTKHFMTELTPAVRAKKRKSPDRSSNNDDDVYTFRSEDSDSDNASSCDAPKGVEKELIETVFARCFQADGNDASGADVLSVDSQPI